ncbi:MAG: sigma-70 family RNA polymerase sigma factor [Phycisphaerales bacterium]|nr:sigma-70 family RNA polymerase sigma factor [Phycisphaerales bacterium]
MKTVTAREAGRHVASANQSPRSRETTGKTGPQVRRTPARHGRSASSEPDRITETWKQYKAQPNHQLRDELVAHYMDRHVRLIAERFRASLPPSVDVDDLTQQGYLGLVRSIERYQLDRGTRFETFSSLRIIGAMRDWLREQDHIPRQVRQRSRAVGAALERFQVIHGRTPDAWELSELLDLPLEDALVSLSNARPPAMVTFSTVTATADAGNAELSDLAGLADTNPDSSPLHDLGRDDLRKWIIREMENRDQLIVVLYYYENMTMREIGLVLGCSESRVSQRLNSILLRLRAKFTSPEDAAQLTPLD